MKPIKLAILGSTRGTVMTGIIDAIDNKQLNAEIKVVISNNPAALILEKARKASISTIAMPSENEGRAAYDRKVLAKLAQFDIDLIVLIGYMRILSKDFIDNWRGKIINIHPSLLPKYAGLMNLAVHQAVINAAEKESGCSVHLVDEQVDHGEVLIQKKCTVEKTDTAQMLKQKVQQLELMALIEAITNIHEEGSENE